MGTTLTGTTPQDTYDSLIKVTDNGPLSGTAKYLSDGLGNDSVLALSTGFVGIGTTSAVGGRMELAIGGSAAGSAIQLGRGGTNKATIQLDSGDVFSIENNGAFPISFATNAAERMRITSAGNVGIGTSAPVSKLNVDGSITATGGARTNPTGGGSIVLDYQTTGDIQGRVRSRDWDGALWKNITLEGANIIAAPSGTEVGRFTSNGLTFNGDTAAANALDDYEEGTFTPTFVGATITGGIIRGSYTKIGRQVYITVQFVNATISGAASTASVQSLPFTNNALNFGVATITYCDALNTTNASAWIDTSSTTIVLMDGTGTASFASFVNGTTNRSMMLNAVYQV